MSLLFKNLNPNKITRGFVLFGVHVTNKKRKGTQAKTDVFEIVFFFFWQNPNDDRRKRAADDLKKILLRPSWKWDQPNATADERNFRFL